METQEYREILLRAFNHIADVTDDLKQPLFGENLTPAQRKEITGICSALLDVQHVIIDARHNAANPQEQHTAKRYVIIVINPEDGRTVQGTTAKYTDAVEIADRCAAELVTERYAVMEVKEHQPQGEYTNPQRIRVTQLRKEAGTERAKVEIWETTGTATASGKPIPAACSVCVLRDTPEKCEQYRELYPEQCLKAQ